jgi:hypothetical protein
MSGLNKQNADHAYNNFTVTNTGLVNNLVSRTLNNISTNGQIDTDEIVANSVSAIVVTSDAYASQIGSVSANWSSPAISVINNALVGKIILNGVNPGSASATILVTNSNVSQGDLVFLTQLTDLSSTYFSPLYLQTVQNGSFRLSATPISGGGKPKPGAVEIGYFIVKNSA